MKQCIKVAGVSGYYKKGLVYSFTRIYRYLVLYVCVQLVDMRIPGLYTW